MWRRALGALAAIALSSAAATAADPDCTGAHKNAMEKLRRAADERMPPDQLAAMRRMVQRAYNACLTGHVDDPKRLFERLDRSRN